MSVLKTAAVLAAGFAAGALTILNVRFFTYSPASTHYHANFAVYTNGQKVAFDNPIYYLDGGCGMSEGMTPEARAHLAKGYDGVVHVKDEAVTWGQFFENLGWYVGDDFMKLPDGMMYAASGPKKLHIIINNQDYTDLGGITNRVIKDQDRLLISYGNETKNTVDGQFNAVPATAAKYDGMKSAAACGHSASVTARDRLTHLL